MKHISIRRVAIPQPDQAGEKADAIPHKLLLVLQWICDKCECVNSHKIDAKSVYTEDDIKKVAIASFNFAFYNCKCCASSKNKDDKTAKSVPVKK